MDIAYIGAVSRTFVWYSAFQYAYLFIWNLQQFTDELLGKSHYG